MALLGGPGALSCRVAGDRRTKAEVKMTVGGLVPLDTKEAGKEDSRPGQSHAKPQ